MNLTSAPMRRAAGFFCYLQDNTRLLDLSLENGSLFLGHRVPALSQALKRALDKGQLSSYSTFEQRRCSQAVSAFFPSALSIRFYQTLQQALKGAAASDLIDPLRDEGAALSGENMLFRPGLPLAAQRSARLFVLAPLGPALSFWIVLDFKRDSQESAPQQVSSLQLAGFRAIASRFFDPVLPDCNNDSLDLSSQGWARKGRYLLFGGTAAQYELQRERALRETHIIFPPSVDTPAIIPDQRDSIAMGAFVKGMKKLYAY